MGRKAVGKHMTKVVSLSEDQEFGAQYNADYQEAVRNLKFLINEPVVLPSGDSLRRDILIPRVLNGYTILTYPITDSNGVDTGRYNVAWNGV